LAEQSSEQSHFDFLSYSWFLYGFPELNGIVSNLLTHTKFFHFNRQGLAVPKGWKQVTFRGFSTKKVASMGLVPRYGMSYENGGKNA
jgi:hypothetical protein